MRSDSEPEWLDRLGVEQPTLRRLGGYWQRLRAGRAMPRRDELEPWAIPDLLPHLWIWRVQAEPPTFFLRLAGGRINRLLGDWRRGSELGEVVPAHAQAPLRARYGRVAFGPAVLRARGYALLGREYGVRVRAERLLLPLGGGADAAEDILGITWYEDLPRRGATDIPDGGDESVLALDTLDSLSVIGDGPSRVVARS
ncbi:PAS domain-containing protein [Tistlia consotensis]|uniref:PAS domain-containing protein n=1 Tax=Tistlia consotensis TaxID=1321365 RepID=UPI0013562BBE|nr:PAS domain-containing protein [Tistlia consotensis]